MKREVKTVRQIITLPVVPADFGGDLRAWLAAQARANRLRWLLAHADDGVIWGEVVEGVLHLASDVFGEVSPSLRAITLQQARLFSQNGELLLWLAGHGWKARLVIEGEGDEAEVFDERHLLWGTHLVEQREPFALLRHGMEGLRHAPPIRASVDVEAKLRVAPYLVVRHVLDYDSDPARQARIAFSRLVSVHPQG